ncbi:MAG: hypothetical protein KGI25_05490, partial [Thaumarchaeota archaeon]|nr:hypothetical protein [Nitrososphaerota archaeon]
MNRTIVGLVALMVISSPLLVTMPHYASAASSLGIMIPLYTYPTDGTWTAVINAKNAHPSVPIVVIADISGSGAGSSSDPNFVTGINN